MAVCGCEETIRLFSVELDKDQTKKDFQLACRVCAWYATACLLRHAMLISRYRIPFLGAFDRDASGVKVPTSSILIRLSILRLGPENEENSTVDEGAPPRISGWTGCGRPIEVSTGYTVREICDAQTLASPGRWPVALRKYPQNGTWTQVSDRFMSLARRHGSLVILTSLTFGKVE